jgi:hypothetical protein
MQTAGGRTRWRPEINLIDADVYQRGGPPHDQFS